MSAYQVETNRYGSLSEAIADAFASEYEVHVVSEVEPGLFYRDSVKESSDVFSVGR